MSALSDHLLVFFPSCPPEAAASLGALASAASCDIRIYIDSDAEESVFQSFIKDGISIHHLVGKHMGEWLHHGFAQSFTDAKRVVVLDARVAAIDADLIQSAFTELHRNDCVLGPKLDGGFYLLGMSYFYEEALTEVDWAQPQLFSSLVDKFRKYYLSYAFVKMAAGKN